MRKIKIKMWADGELLHEEDTEMKEGMGLNFNIQPDKFPPITTKDAAIAKIILDNGEVIHVRDMKDENSMSYM